jgi:hypothetical protein
LKTLVALKYWHCLHTESYQRVHCCSKILALLALGELPKGTLLYNYIDIAYTHGVTKGYIITLVASKYWHCLHSGSYQRVHCCTIILPLLPPGESLKGTLFYLLLNYYAIACTWGVTIGYMLHLFNYNGIACNRSYKKGTLLPLQLLD